MRACTTRRGAAQHSTAQRSGERGTRSSRDPTEPRDASCRVHVTLATLKPSTIFRCRQDSSLSPSLPPGISSACCRTLVLQNEAQARHERPEINIISRVACAGDMRIASSYASPHVPAISSSLREKPLCCFWYIPVRQDISNAKSSRASTSGWRMIFENADEIKTS